MILVGIERLPAEITGYDDNIYIYHFTCSSSFLLSGVSTMTFYSCDDSVYDQAKGLIGLPVSIDFIWSDLSMPMRRRLLSISKCE